TQIGNFEIGESEISNPKSEISDRRRRRKPGTLLDHCRLHQDGSSLLPDISDFGLEISDSPISKFPISVHAPGIFMPLFHPVRGLPKLMQNLSGSWHPQHAFTFPIVKVFRTDRRRVPISQIDLTAHVRRYRCRQSDACARGLY